MVMIYAKDGKEQRFDVQQLENDLKAAGLPQRLAQEVAERVKNRVQDGWTAEKVRQETDVELHRLAQTIDRAHRVYSKSMADHWVGEKRYSKDEYSPSTQPLSENKVVLSNIEE
jgi:hypothetical protein